MMARRRLFSNVACRGVCSYTSMIIQIRVLKVPKQNDVHTLLRLRLFSSSSKEEDGKEEDGKNTGSDDVTNKDDDDTNNESQPPRRQTLTIDFANQDPFYERRDKRLLKEYNTKEMKSFTELVEIHMPELDAFHHGQVVQWHKQPGDVIRYEDVLCDIQFDLLDGYEAEPGEEQNDVSALLSTFVLSSFCFVIVMNNWHHEYISLTKCIPSISPSLSLCPLVSPELYRH